MILNVGLMSNNLTDKLSAGMVRLNINTKPKYSAAKMINNALSKVKCYKLTKIELRAVGG
jgi:hypothetical protein